MCFVKQQGGWGSVHGAVAEHGEQYVGTSSYQAGERGDVMFALAPLSVVVGPGDRVAQRGGGGQVESKFRDPRRRLLGVPYTGHAMPGLLW
jgi:hypothetical protein